MRRTTILPAIALGLSSFALWTPAQATGGIPGLISCGSFPDVQICSGEVASWDGAQLDVDLTLPASGTGGRHPLIVMLHGFGNNKHEWESMTDAGDNGDKWHWNNHWFAAHGFYVIDYTARGFFDDGPDPSRPDEPNTPAGIPLPCTRPGSACLPNGTIHLKSREFEIRDTQWLAALVAVAHPDLERDEIAVTGGSYGGGESWLQASQPVWDANAFALVPRTPRLPRLQLQVVVPKYPWTDLAYSLAPNGHPGPFQGSIYTSSQGSPTDPTESGQGNPFGNVKLSYVSGFFFQGLVQGMFEQGTTTTPSGEGKINLTAAAVRAVTGDPYDVAGAEDPIVAQIRRGLTEFRGAFYQDDAWTAELNRREVAIFSISGWTDDLFPPVESFRQFKYLKSLDPLWPVDVAVADVGHPRAQNPPSEWQRLNSQAWTFLGGQIGGSHRQPTSVTSLPTVCPPQPGTSNTEELAAATPEELAHGSLTVHYSTAGLLRNPKTTPNEDPDNLATDPVTGFLAGTPPCRASVTQGKFFDTTARYTGFSSPLDQARTLLGLGRVHLTFKLTGATTATLNARVWDVAPGGSAQLVTRGTYRIDFPAYDTLTRTIDLPLFGNQWGFVAGHAIRLDLTQVDSPTFLPSNSAAAFIAFDGADLVLPTLETGSLAISGA